MRRGSSSWPSPDRSGTATATSGPWRRRRLPRDRRRRRLRREKEIPAPIRLAAARMQNSLLWSPRLLRRPRLPRSRGGGNLFGLQGSPLACLLPFCPRGDGGRFRRSGACGPTRSPSLGSSRHTVAASSGRASSSAAELRGLRQAGRPTRASRSSSLATATSTEHECRVFSM